MKNQEKTAVAKAEELQLKLEDEISKLRRRDSELEQLSHVDDNIHFIQVPESNCTGPEWSICFFLIPKMFMLCQSQLMKQAKALTHRL